MVNKLCGYEVTGMILLRDLEGAMRHDRSNDKSVRVSTRTNYDLNALTPVVGEVVAFVRHVFYTSRCRNS
jgi:hypothetical protein